MITNAASSVKDYEDAFGASNLNSAMRYGGIRSDASKGQFGQIYNSDGTNMTNQQFFDLIGKEYTGVQPTPNSSISHSTI